MVDRLACHAVSPATAERWRDFWNRRPTGGPLIGAALESPGLGAVLRRDGGPLNPSDIDLAGYLAQCDLTAAEAHAFRGDAAWAASPLQGFPWTEAICGCSVHSAGGSLWAERPVREDPDAALAGWQHSPWLALFFDILQAMITHAAGRYAVGLPVLRGPADILSALRGPSAFCLDLYDAPDQSRKWLAGCADAYCEVTRRGLKMLAEYYQGNVQASRQVWAPGPCIETQQDAAALISPAFYRTFLLPVDRQLWSLAPYSFRHCHSATLQHLADLLQEPTLPAIQITADDGGPTLADLAQRAGEVQAAGKPLILYGKFSADDVVALARRLHPKGLYISVKCSAAGDAHTLLRNLDAARSSG